jgi:hypothetical protein
MRITGTFITDAFTDIPDQNWDLEQWDADYRAMKATGIDTVVLQRAGIEKFKYGGGWVNYSSKVLEKYCPTLLKVPEDSVGMHLALAEKYSIKCFVGTYRQFKGFEEPGHGKVIDLGRKVLDELWELYSNYSSFAGWYLPFEICRAHQPLDAFDVLGRHCKDISKLSVMISPSNDGKKNIWIYDSKNRKDDFITFEQHQKDWKQMMPKIANGIDAIAFQDGHVDFDQLLEFSDFNSTLAKEYGIEFWSNTETFDRDVPIKFLPISWYKLHHKLNVARDAAASKVITFEFSHFMSPNSCWPAAQNLHKRYCQHFGISQ